MADNTDVGCSGGQRAVTEKFVVVCVFWLFLCWMPWCIAGIGSCVSGPFGFSRTTLLYMRSGFCSRISVFDSCAQVGFLWSFYSRCTLT